VAVIPEEEIQAVRRMVESSLMVEPHPFLRFGDQVRVKSGPLEGIEGILLRKKNSCRLVISVEMLHQAVAVEVDISVIERVARQHRWDTRMPRVIGEAWDGPSRAFAG
jgi:transcription antitermination factor NusG